MKESPVERFMEYRLEDVKASGAAAGASALFVGVEGLLSFYLFQRCYPKPTLFEVNMALKEGTPPRAVVKQVMNLLGCKRAVKSFTEATGNVTYQMKTSRYEVNLTAGPPASCEVEEYEEEVTTPARPEEKNMVKKFRLIDPKCLETGNAWGHKKTGLEQDVEKEGAAMKAAVAIEEGISQGDVEAVAGAAAAMGEDLADHPDPTVRMATITGEDDEAVNTSFPSEEKES